MISLHIPGFGPVELEHLVLDYNGTIAFDGDVIEGVDDILLVFGYHDDVARSSGESLLNGTKSVCGQYMDR